MQEYIHIQYTLYPERVKLNHLPLWAPSLPNEDSGIGEVRVLGMVGRKEVADRYIAGEERERCVRV